MLNSLEKKKKKLKNMAAFRKRKKEARQLHEDAANVLWRSRPTASWKVADPQFLGQAPVAVKTSVRTRLLKALEQALKDDPELAADMPELKHVVGIDGGKDVNFAYDQLTKREFKFGNTRKDLDAFMAQIREIHGPVPDVVIGIEESGRFCRPIVKYLIEQGVIVRKIPSHLTKTTRQENSPGQNKTDRIDAKTLTKILRKKKDLTLPFRDLAPVYTALHDLSVAFDQRTKLLTMTYNQLHKLLESGFPEFAAVFNNDIHTRTPREVLKRYPGPKEVAKVSLRDLEAFIYVTSYQKHGMEKARELKQAAKTTIGVPHNHFAEALKLQLELIDSLEDQRKDLEKAINTYLADVPYASNLMGIPGIGFKTAATLLGHLGDLRDYSHPRQLYTATGLNMITHESGTQAGRYRISRVGNHTVRRALFDALRAAFFLKSSPLYGWYRRLPKLQGPGAHHRRLVACMRKLLRIIFAVVRDNVPFDPSRYSGEADGLSGAELA